MNSLFLPNFSPCYCRPFSRAIKNANMIRIKSPRCAISLSIGEESFRYESVVKFPRRHMKDPYKLLGIPSDASESEIRGAHHFLINQYSSHEPSVEAIELAYEEIMMRSFRERKRAKINLRSKLRRKVEESPDWVKTFLGFLDRPKMEIVWRRAFLFGFLAGWSILTKTESGPAFQVALSLMACIFFLNDKMKNGWRASLTGLGALIVGWTIGSFTIPLIPSTFFPPSWSLELITALISYFFLFLACVFIK